MSNQAVYTEPIKEMPPHGMVGTSEYWAWRDIKKRCYNPNNKWYCNYGGRGIKMQENWITNFMQFYEDVGPKPSKGYSIDRIDNNGDYTAENCRWASKETQDNNRRTNVFVEYENQKKTIAQWAKQFNVDPAMFRYFLNKGLNVEQAAKKVR